MANTVLNPSSARKDFYKLLKDVNENHTEIEIISEHSENNAVLIGLDVVRKREKDDSRFTKIDKHVVEIYSAWTHYKSQQLLVKTSSRGIMYLLSNYIVLGMRDLSDYKNKKTRQFNHVDST